MIQCMTYNEARMEVIALFAHSDCDLKEVRIIFDEKNKCFWVSREETIDIDNETFWFEFNGWEERKK